MIGAVLFNHGVFSLSFTSLFIALRRPRSSVVAAAKGWIERLMLARTTARCERHRSVQSWGVMMYAALSQPKPSQHGRLDSAGPELLSNQPLNQKPVRKVKSDSILHDRIWLRTIFPQVTQILRLII
jgi:hypothetical protein